MSRSSAHSDRRRGFTLPELLLAVTLSGILFTAILGAYLFLGRSLTRLVNVHRQEVESRRLLRQFTEDVSAAISLPTGTASQIQVVKMTGASSPTTTTVSYVYQSSSGTISRTDASGTLTLVSGITPGAFVLTYYNEGGTAITPAPQSVKSVELSYTSELGNAGSGTRARYVVVSPRVVLRNKPVLQ